MAKITHNQKTGKHTISNLSDEDLKRIHMSLPGSSKLRFDIYHHLIECVTEEELKDLNYDAKTYVDNFLGLS